ncbi:hypothetical protein HXX76_013871 [Chlamydomonas incerta]|uniref:BTB domain-containing protein n=1 Tax=Chlamydomonas incerta TaxID=51695 RepID=A0A835VRN6_CHLIN|nr:hypothetical protein HXX76_013871 [Chlamydomonas incerta]|eukprot:KAG2425290.1 hypothetical protein HXX76_013871 [Chlamydomonas incerta]
MKANANGRFSWLYNSEAHSDVQLVLRSGDGAPLYKASGFNAAARASAGAGGPPRPQGQVDAGPSSVCGSAHGDVAVIDAHSVVLATSSDMMRSWLSGRWGSSHDSGSSNSSSTVSGATGCGCIASGRHVLTLRVEAGEMEAAQAVVRWMYTQELGPPAAAAERRCGPPCGPSSSSSDADGADDADDADAGPDAHMHLLTCMLLADRWLMGACAQQAAALLAAVGPAGGLSWRVRAALLALPPALAAASPHPEMADLTARVEASVRRSLRVPELAWEDAGTRRLVAALPAGRLADLLLRRPGSADAAIPHQQHQHLHQHQQQQQQRQQQQGSTGGSNGGSSGEVMAADGGAAGAQQLAVSSEDVVLTALEHWFRHQPFALHLRGGGGSSSGSGSGSSSGCCCVANWRCEPVPQPPGLAGGGGAAAADDRAEAAAKMEAEVEVEAEVEAEAGAALAGSKEEVCGQEDEEEEAAEEAATEVAAAEEAAAAAAVLLPWVRYDLLTDHFRAAVAPWLPGLCGLRLHRDLLAAAHRPPAAAPGGSGPDCRRRPAIDAIQPPTQPPAASSHQPSCPLPTEQLQAQAQAQPMSTSLQTPPTQMPTPAPTPTPTAQAQAAGNIACSTPSGSSSSSSSSSSIENSPPRTRASTGNAGREQPAAAVREEAQQQLQQHHQQLATEAATDAAAAVAPDTGQFGPARAHCWGGGRVPYRAVRRIDWNRPACDVRIELTGVGGFAGDGRGLAPPSPATRSLLAALRLLQARPGGSGTTAGSGHSNSKGSSSCGTGSALHLSPGLHLGGYCWHLATRVVALGRKKPRLPPAPVTPAAPVAAVAGVAAAAAAATVEAAPDTAAAAAAAAAVAATAAWLPTAASAWLQLQVGLVCSAPRCGRCYSQSGYSCSGCSPAPLPPPPLRVGCLVLGLTDGAGKLAWSRSWSPCELSPVAPGPGGAGAGKGGEGEAAGAAGPAEAWWEVWSDMDGMEPTWWDVGGVATAGGLLRLHCVLQLQAH